MADLKVSQEVDLGFAGIDGSVEFRVIKGGLTYRQSYADLFSYIGIGVTLQKVVDNDRTLVDNILLLGTDAGVWQTGTNLVGIGQEAGSGQFGIENNLIGFQAGKDSGGSWVSAMGYQAGLNNASDFVVAIGYNSALDNTGPQLTALGSSDAGVNNTGDTVVAVGKAAGKANQGGICIFIGSSAGQNNTGDRVVAIGENSAKGNSLSNQFVIATDVLPAFADAATANASYILAAASLSPGSTYLYRNIATSSIGFYSA